jgi:hypothetical protein
MRKLATILALGLLLLLSAGTTSYGSNPVGDVNADGIVNVNDALYILNYLFRGGPPPCNTSGDMLGYSGCKEFGKDPGTSPDQDCIEYQYDGQGVLLMKHVNAGFNCCPDTILAGVSLVGNTIIITENESLEPSGGCDCICLFDVDYQVDNLPPGEYTITVNELYLQPGEEILEFTVDLSSVTSGSYCVERNDYPWGIWE